MTIVSTLFRLFLQYTFLGQFLVIATPNQLMAQLLAAFLNQMWTIFNVSFAHRLQSEA